MTIYIKKLLKLFLFGFATKTCLIKRLKALIRFDKIKIENIRYWKSSVTLNADVIGKHSKFII